MAGIFRGSSGGRVKRHAELPLIAGDRDIAKLSALPGQSEIAARTTEDPGSPSLRAAQPGS